MHKQNSEPSDERRSKAFTDEEVEKILTEQRVLSQPLGKGPHGVIEVHEIQQKRLDNSQKIARVLHSQGGQEQLDRVTEKIARKESSTDILPFDDQKDVAWPTSSFDHQATD